MGCNAHIFVNLPVFASIRARRLIFKSRYVKLNKRFGSNCA